MVGIVTAPAICTSTDLIPIATELQVLTRCRAIPLPGILGRRARGTMKSSDVTELPAARNWIDYWSYPAGYD